MASNLRRAVSAALVSVGFSRSGRRHLRHHFGDFSLVVDTGPLDGFGDIAPWIGIQHSGIEELAATLFELPFDRYQATVGSNVGYVLSGEYASWTGIEEGRIVLAEIERGLSRLEEYESLERLPDAFAIRGARPFGALSVAPTYVYRRDTARVTDCLRQAEAESCVQPGPVCDQYRRFERNALAFLARPA